MQRRFVSDVSHELRTPLTTVRMAGDVLHDARDRLRPGDRPRRRAAADRARPVRDAARRPARDQPLRRRRRGARPRGRQPRRRRAPGGRVDPGRWPSARGTRGRRTRRRPPVRRRGRRAPGRADRAQPGHQRHRPRRQRRRRSMLVAADDDAAAIAVRDHGVGLRPGEAAMVFNRFWRADPARARTTGGTGLGPVDLAGGRPPARRLAAGLGRARRGRAVPADPAPPGRATGSAPSPLPLVPDDAGARHGRRRYRASAYRRPRCGRKAGTP